MSTFYFWTVLLCAVVVGVCVGVELGSWFGTAAFVYVYIMSPIHPGR